MNATLTPVSSQLASADQKALEALQELTITMIESGKGSNIDRLTGAATAAGVDRAKLTEWVRLLEARKALCDEHESMPGTDYVDEARAAYKADSEALATAEAEFEKSRLAIIAQRQAHAASGMKISQMMNSTQQGNHEFDRMMRKSAAATGDPRDWRNIHWS